MQTVTSEDGTEIAYERRGEGPPLILLHGDTTRRYWDPVIPQFAGDYAVVAPDRRGRGDSGDADTYDLESEVADVRAVIEAVEGDPVLFGHSFGGLQAIEAARTADVRALAVYEPAVLVGEYRESADLADRIEERLEEGDRRGAMKAHLREVIHGGEIDDLDAWLAEWPPWPEYVRFAELNLRMDRIVERYRLPDSLDVDAPGLVLTGTEGPSHLRESARAVRDALSDGRLVEFDGVGHAGPAESPELIASAVRAFLRDSGLEAA